MFSCYSVRELDPLVYLLSKLCEDDVTKSFLRRHAENVAASQGFSLTPASQVTSQLPAPGSKMTPEELEKVCSLSITLFCCHDFCKCKH